jgi:hypothetical protein
MSHAHYRRPRRGGGAAFLILVGAAFLLYLTWLGGLLEPLPIAALMVGLVVLLVFGVLVRRHRGAEREPSTAHVIAASPSPPGGIVGRCDMRLLVEVPGGGSITVRHRDPATPIPVWPQPGMLLAVDVHPRNPRDLTVRWSAVPELNRRRAIGAGPAYDPRPSSGAPPVFDDPSVFDAASAFNAGSAFNDLPSLDEPGTERLALPSLPPTDVEPGVVVRRYLYPTERYRGEWRRHGIRLAKELAVGAVVALLIVRGEELTVGAYAVRLADVPEHELVGGGLWAVWFLWRWSAWHTARLALTTVRVILVKGVFIRRVYGIPLAAIAHVGHGQSVAGRVLGYGWFRFAGLGPFHPLWRIGDLPEPNTLYLELVEECFAPDAAEARHNLPQL